MIGAPVVRRRPRRAAPDRSRPLLVLGGVAAMLIGAAIALGFSLANGRVGDGVASVSGSPAASRAAASNPSTPSSDAALPSGRANAEPETGIRATRITIERLGIDLPIVAGDGIDAPMGQAAHYPGSAWPGGATKNVYIYAHAQEGMFLDLWDARIGDEVVLKLADGTQRTYVVTEVLPEVAWDALEYTEPTLSERLTLQTSTSDTMTAPRFVVIAEPPS